MLHHNHQKILVSIFSKLSCLSLCKKSTASLTSYSTYSKETAKCFCVICRQKINFIPMLLWRYCKDMQTYFGYFGYTWLQSTKMIVSPCRMLHFLSACKKSCTFFLRYYILKDRVIWLADSILTHNLRPKIFTDMLVKYQYQY